MLFFWLNTFPPSKPDTGLPNTKSPLELAFGTVMDYRKVCQLHSFKYVTHNTIDIYLTVGAINLILLSVRHWEIMYGTRVPRTHVL